MSVRSISPLSIQRRARNRRAGGGRQGRAAPAGHRSPGRARGGRRAAAAAGRVEPALERRQVHAPRRTCAGAAATGGLARRDHRERHRRRHRARIPPASVSAIQTGGRHVHPRAQRARPGAGDQPSPDRGARRTDRSDEPGHRSGDDHSSGAPADDRSRGTGGRAGPRAPCGRLAALDGPQHGQPRRHPRPARGR